MKLSIQDLEIIRRFREFGILADIQAHLIDEEEGTVLVTCGDGDQSDDIFNHHAKIQNSCRSHPRIHVLSMNGGALRLSPFSPANSPRSTFQEDQIAEICDAIAMKGFKAVALYIHAPCGKAHACDISFVRSLQLLFNAKATVKGAFSGITVSCFCHIDYGTDFSCCGKTKRRLTYFADRVLWEKFSGIYVPTSAAI